MSILIEAIYIFDGQNQCILDHVYRARPPRPSDLAPYLRNNPYAPVVQLSDLNPPTTVYSVKHGSLYIRCTTSTDSYSLAVLEFLHRTVDILEEFLGSPLLLHKIEENYEVIGQLLSEICDGGVVCNTETNALRESVEVSTRLGKLFEQVGLPGSSPALGPTNLAATLKASSAQASGPALPWRRANVRHTSNELYVDILESLSVIFAPSGRPLSARANGSIAFTSKISGVPDLILQLNAPGGSSLAKSSGIARTMQSPVFHPCVRLAKWKEHPGELSFIPPDGKFMLAGYEVDLLPSSLDSDEPPSQNERLFLPAVVDMRIGLGPSGTEFEARLTLNTNFPGVPTAKPIAGSGRTGASAAPFSFGGGPSSGSSSAPILEAVVVTIPLSDDCRTVTEIKPSRGDATFKTAEREVEWRVPTKDGFSVNGTATLTGAIHGIAAALDEIDEDEADFDPAEGAKSNSLSGYYDEGVVEKSKAYANGVTSAPKQSKAEHNKKLMPRSIMVSFAVKGWLPSGIKVEGLNVNPKTSKGLGDGVRPYKGVKYLTVSKNGIERRL